MSARFLLITETPPWPPDNGGRQRSHLMLSALRALGEVDMVLLARKPGVIGDQLRARLETDFGLVAVFEPPHCWPQPWELLRRCFPRSVQQAVHVRSDPAVQYRIDPRAWRWLDQRIARLRYDLVVGRILRPTLRAGAHLLTPTVVDIDDLDTDHLATLIRELPAGSPRRRLEYLHARLVDFLQPRLQRFAGCWLANPADQEELGGIRVGVLRNIPFASDEDSFARPLPSAADSQTVLTVGSIDYAVNRRGIARFLANVWPQILAAVPGARFRIVGGGMTEAVRAEWQRHPQVDAVGYAEDLRVEYQQAALAVSPVYEGGGTKIKVLEALAHGRTCAVTAHSWRGYERELRHEESLWVGKTDDRLAAGIVDLLGNPARRQQLEQHGWQQVRKHFSTASFHASVAELVNAVRAAAPGPVRNPGDS